MASLIPALQSRVWAYTRPRLPRLVYANGGLGDELMLTAVAHAARVAGRPLHVLTDQPECWRGNRDPASLQTGVERWHYACRRGWMRTEIIHLAYLSGNGRHVADQMAERAAVTLAPDWRPVLRLPRPPPRNSRLLVLQNSCRGARYAADTKEWAQERWQELARRLAREFTLVQIGTRRDPPLDAARDQRGRTTLRAAADLVAGAAALIGLESGLMHVAAAVGTPAVIIYGGRTRPKETGYPFHRNLTRSPPCAGCALNSGCPHSLMCLDIPVEEVEQAVRETCAPA